MNQLILNVEKSEMKRGIDINSQEEMHADDEALEQRPKRQNTRVDENELVRLKRVLRLQVGIRAEDIQSTSSNLINETWQDVLNDYNSKIKKLQLQDEIHRDLKTQCPFESYVERMYNNKKSKKRPKSTELEDLEIARRNAYCVLEVNRHLRMK